MKYELSQVIYYLGDTGQICSAPVLTRAKIENLHEDYASTPEQEKIWCRFGPAGIFYVTCHGVFPEEKCFGNKADFLEMISEKLEMI